MSPSIENAIEIENVTKRFGAHTAVENLNLTVPIGSVYGFIGPNGSGKTTTLRMILRIFQPDQGNVRVLGQSKGKTADNRLGYLPEERGLYKRMKVRALLTYYAKLKGFYDCQGEIDKWLKRLDAESWSNKRIDSLSKGMAQKVQFITSVIARPQLVILDEPFSGLDPVNMEMLRDAVFWLRENGATVVFSTHDMGVAEKMCDTIFMIFQGKKVLDGSLDSIQSEYAADRLRVGFADSQVEMPKLESLTTIEKIGGRFECQLENPQQSQQILKQLAEYAELNHFEVVKPTLHEIFVRIASPNSKELL